MADSKPGQFGPPDAPGGYGASVYVPPPPLSNDTYGVDSLTELRPIQAVTTSLYVGFIAVGWIVLPGLLTVVAWRVPEADDLSMMLATTTIIMAVVGCVVWVFLLERAWAMIQDGAPRISTLLAVGLMLVPGVNVIWAFVAHRRVATELNEFRDRHRVPSRGVTGPLFLAQPVLMFLAFTGYLALEYLPRVNWPGIGYLGRIPYGEPAVAITLWAAMALLVPMAWQVCGVINAAAAEQQRRLQPIFPPAPPPG